MSFLSGEYNFHQFSVALGLVTNVSFIKQTFCLLSVSTSCSHKHLDPLPQVVLKRLAELDFHTQIHVLASTSIPLEMSAMEKSETMEEVLSG